MKNSRRKLKQAQAIYGCGAVVFVAGFIAENGWIVVAGLALVMIGMVLVLERSKCPHCGAYVRETGGGDAKFCPECGKKIEFE